MVKGTKSKIEVCQDVWHQKWSETFHRDCTAYLLVAENFCGRKISPSPAIYLCIAEIFHGIYFHQCGIKVAISAM